MLLGWALVPAVGAMAADSFRHEVETEWQKQDACRVAEIREPGLVRFVDTELAWPGVKPDERLRVPKAPAPKIDGRLDDPCWKQAARLDAAAADQPSLLLSHDGDRVYVGVAMPSDIEPGYQGVSTALDAAGAVDGVKNGLYAFHTGHEPNPWWQVDLGKRLPIGRIVVYNRLDYQPGLHNADNLLILTSDDEKSWKPVYDNRGKHFGGVTGGGPLVVDFTQTPPEGGQGRVEARFVRLQIKSPRPIFFHLDEVEIYGTDDPAKNVALKRPARQSSLSIWSRGGNQGGALLTLGKVKVLLDKNDPAGVIVDGVSAPAEQARVHRDGKRTGVEIALPLKTLGGRFPSELVAPDGRTTALAAGNDWRLIVPREPRLGYGRNRLVVELKAARPIDPPLDVSVELVVFTPKRPERQTVFARKLTASSKVPVEFQVAHEGAAAVIVSAGPEAGGLRDGRVFFVEPIGETIRRADRLLEDFDSAAPEGLADLRMRHAKLIAREGAEGPDPEARNALYREARWLARQVAFQNPRLDFEELVFVKRFTQETYPDVCLNHMPWVSRPGGDVCILGWARFDARPEARNVLSGKLGPGHVHGMDLWYDADRVVFGYSKAKSDQPPEGWLDRRTSYQLRRTEEPTHIFEVGVDGRGLEQLTDGEWSDLDPTYLPGGEIAFVSERCGCSLQCNELDKDETSCNLYVMRPDGTNVRRMSVTKDGDYLPHALDDGTVAYTRWEYQERGWAHVQSVWFVRPDGTGADALFKQHLNNPWALEDMRSLPGSTKMVAVATGHHTLAAGPVVILDPHQGMNSPAGIRIVTPGVLPPEGGMTGTPVAAGGVVGRGGYYMTPWPISENHFLASYAYCNGATGGLATEVDPTGYALYLIDVYGTKELVYRDPSISCFVPVPLKPRPRPPVVADVADAAVPYATCSVSNVGYGVKGVPAESIRYLRIAQRLQWPYDNTHGGQRYEPNVKTVMVNWTPCRVLGEVPVEKDGSAHFRVPADTPVYFQILDENHMELRRMRSFISFQPGEIRACHGCHETREEAPSTAIDAFPLALARDPSALEPPPWGDRTISFLRDVQPVFDEHCVSCHGGLKPAAGLDFSAGLTASNNRAYDTILAQGLVSRSNVGDDAKITPPLAFGSHKSKLVDVLRNGPCGTRARLGDEDWLRLVTWIDANAPYHDGFLNKRPATAPYDLAADQELAGKIAAVHAKRCGGCHQPAEISRLDWIDLDRPQESLFLTAPLSKNAAGTERCREVVYKSQTDPDYQSLRKLVEAVVEKAWASPRRDLKAFGRPPRVDGVTMTGDR
jgi:mono/diheme cytochrome c family protein